MSLVKRILEGLSAPFTEGELTIGEIIYHPYKMLYGDLYKISKRNSLNQAVIRAQKKGLVRKKIINEEVYFAITDSGKDELEKWRSKPRIGLHERKGGWDGKYRLVLFDIPEKNRIVRNSFRRKLKELGFLGWQQSVWVSRNPITEPLREFIKEVGLDDYALVVETEDLGSTELEAVINKHNQ